MSLNEVFNMYFGIIDDDRCEVNVLHPLIDVLKLCLIATLCGVDELDKIVDYGENKKEFLEKEFKIKDIPSKPTLTRIFAMIDSKMLSLSIACILRHIITANPEQIMLDGKAIRATDAIKSIEKMMNIVTAYTDTGIAIGQKTVDSKSNEIPAVRELIEMLDIEGKVLTMDAMHCQKETVEKIIDKKGDYVVQLKANHGTFHEDVYAMFDDKYIDETDRDCEYEIYSTMEKNHGRIEKRTCYVLNEIAFFTNYINGWKGLKKIFAVKREVERDGKTTKEISCYLSSKNASAEKLLSYTRNHWKIESMHHILDVSFDEDNCRLYSQKAQENMNIFRKGAISIHKQYLGEDKKKTVKSNMFNCLINDSYLLEILQSCHNR